MNLNTKLTGSVRPLMSRLTQGSWSKTFRDSAVMQGAELFTADQMAAHGRALATSHRLAGGRAPNQLLTKLAANESKLIKVGTELSVAIAKGCLVAPAGEWLLDNFDLIEEQICTTKKHLLKADRKGLPRLAHGLIIGHPRIFDIAHEFVTHSDGKVDGQMLQLFVAAYQTVTVLKLGELWVTQIMLRLAIIENLRYIATKIILGSNDRTMAEYWAERMVIGAGHGSVRLLQEIAALELADPQLNSVFVSAFIRRLQGHGQALATLSIWIERRLAGSGNSIDSMQASEWQQQIAEQRSISNCIGSLRILAGLDWDALFSSMSIVDQTLSEDPHGVYGQMDVATRNRYCQATEEIARKGCLSEVEVARKAVELASITATIDVASASYARLNHVGYYLIDKGLQELEQAAKVKHSGAKALQKMAGRCALFLYLGGILMLTLIATGILLSQVIAVGIGFWVVMLTAVLALLATSQLAVTLVNWLATLWVTPHALPRMDFSTGVPAQLRTLVVVPTMLTSAAGVEKLVEALEVRYLANQDQRLHFGLLTDFLDAHHESIPEDAPLLLLIKAKIDALNEKYCGGGGACRGHIFFLFHRSRRWNQQDRLWMGYERKRGKLADLNALLRGSKHSAARLNASEGFSLIAGDIEVLSSVKYVITLDTDTLLPRDAARQFVGAMAHPLNRPCYDKAQCCVIAGYGILQPRVAVSLPGTNRSHYAKLYGSESGVDPYTRASSDVYQDVFGEGSFIGKGIYDVDAFEQVVGGRFPENRILSHDLLEGCYARAGLLSDVHLYEDSPARYSADVSRRHRWVRGDWQLAGWLLRNVPGKHTGAGAQRQGNPLSALSQWKLIDNLRRSLVPTVLTLLLVLGWSQLTSVWLWTLSVVGMLLVPTMLSALFDLLRKPDAVALPLHLATVTKSAIRNIMQVGFELACLPYEAFFCLDAIAHAGWRMLVTRKKLLEWNPSSEVERELDQSERNGFLICYRKMWAAPVLAALLALYFAVMNAAVLVVAGPVLLLWFVSPLIAWWISRPLTLHKTHLGSAQNMFLRALARRTWAFFERFVGAEDHWLPPDNIQEHRADAIAHRTSPTNMGLALLANLSAYDFGYIPSGELILRTANTLGTMERLERFHGHFYNWYDTQTLQALPPLYISSVDSGNLAGHLMTLRAGLSALGDEKILSPSFFAGVRDTFGLLLATADAANASLLANYSRFLDSASSRPPVTLEAARLMLAGLSIRAGKLSKQLSTNRAQVREEDEASDWARALERQCRMAFDELTFLAPWLLLPPAPSALKVYLGGLTGLVTIPSLRTLAGLDVALCPDLAAQCAAEKDPALRRWLDGLHRHVVVASIRSRARMADIEGLARQSGQQANMKYDFLFDKTRRLLSIGYNVTEQQRDSGYYDLLASEARLGSFVAIAQGQLPQENWFALGRLLTRAGGEQVLLSWSGTMFEYLMPLLVMPTYENTLLDQTCKAAVVRQIAYGKQCGVPWGISESGFSRVDLQRNYQYSAFGVPGLCLKSRLLDDLVVAPYASVLALMVAPEAACLNLQRLAADGVLGKYGFFEAIDYTPARQRNGQGKVVVRSHMAHHQGMSLLALAYQLLDRPMQRRFESDRKFQSVLLLLQERIPKVTALFLPTAPRFAVQLMSLTSKNLVPEVALLNVRNHVAQNHVGGNGHWQEGGAMPDMEDKSGFPWSKTSQYSVVPFAQQRAPLGALIQ